MEVSRFDFVGEAYSGLLSIGRTKRQYVAGAAQVGTTPLCWLALETQHETDLFQGLPFARSAA